MIIGGEKVLKYLKDWKFVAISSLIGIYIIVFSVSYIEEMKLPSENWSRSMLVGKIEENSVGDMLKDNVTSVPIPEEELFLSIRYHNNSIYYNEIDVNGNVKGEKNIDVNIPLIRKIQASYTNGLINLYMHNAEEKKLTLVKFDWMKGIISDIEEVDDMVYDFAIEDDFLIYEGKDYIKVRGDNGVVNEVEIEDVKRLAIVKRGNIYHIALIERKDFRNSLKYLTYNLENETLNKYSITKLKGGTQTSADYLGLEILDKKVTIFTVINTPGSMESYVYNYIFPIGDISQIEESSFKLDSVEPTPFIYKTEDNKVLFLAAVTTHNSRNQESVNIIEHTFENGKEVKRESLTKMRSVSIRPNYFKINDDFYLHWTNVSGDRKTIMFASTEKSIIKESQKPRAWEVMDMAFNTLGRFLPITYLMLIPMVFTASPVIIYFLLVSMFKLSWMESNQMKVLKRALLIHILTKLSYTYIYIIDNEVTFQLLPSYLQNFIIMIGVIILTTLISMYCLKDYIYKKENRHFIHYYLLFMIIDITLFAFLFMPYYI